MRAAILAVGSELLGTDRVDTNSLRLTETLRRFGVELRRKAVVGDDEQEVRRLLAESLAAADLVLVSGGLGPTADDVTREAAALALDRELSESAELVAELAAKFARFGMEMPSVNRRQALVPSGARVLSNRRGTAPGLQLEDGERTLFLFPGVPHELAGLVDDFLVPWLAERSGGAGGLEMRFLKVACVPESTLEERIQPLYGEFGRDGLSVLSSAGEIELRLSAAGDAAGRDRLDRLEARLREILGESVFGAHREASLEGVVGELLAAAGRTVVTAESCTGGLIAQRLTRIPGSSAYFLGAAVTYSDRLKRELLDVPGAVLERHGAVSAETVQAMAAGARRRFGADYAVAVSGVAGPGGGSEEKPVGTVHVAVATPGEARHRRLLLPGGRERVRRLASQWALDLLRRELLETARGGGG